VLPYLRLRMADVETRLTDTSGLSWVEQLRAIAPDMP
jgi:ActR/RegA family two-component response regulator